EARLEDIYRVSQGIPFFLSEYAEQLLRGEKFHPLTPAIKAKLSLKLDYLSSQEEELVDYLACFRAPASVSLLARLLGLPMEEVVEITEEFGQKQLLMEEEQGEELVVRFSQEL
ncbi:MAG: LuxR family transcriptional regulator, partial [Streptococcus sp.]